MAPRMGPLPLVAAAVLLGALLPAPPPVAATVAAALFVALGVSRRRRSRLAGLALLLAAGCVGAAYARWSRVTPWTVRPVRVEARVRGRVALPCRETALGARCLLRRDDGGGAWLDTPRGRCDARPGDVVEAVATVRPIVPRRNPPLEDRGAQDVRRGITERWESAACVVVDRAPDLTDRARILAQRLRARIERGIGEVLRGDDLLRARALLFGDTRDLDASEVDAFRETGMAHLLAVSGAHVMLLAAALTAVTLVALRRVRWIALRHNVFALAAVLPLPALTVFVMVTGESASARRALYTAALTALARSLGRRADPRAVLAAVALGMFAADPSCLHDLGWQLSVIATWALVSRPADDTPEERPTALADRALRSARLALFATLRVSLSLTPLLAWRVGRAPVLAVFANLVAAPVGEALALPCVLITAALVCVAPAAVALPFAFVARHALALLFAIAGVAREVTFGSVALPTPTPAQWVVLTAAALALWPWGLRGRVRVALLAMACTAALEVAHRRACHPTGVLRVTALDVGQGDALLIDLPDGEAMLIDGGGALHGERDPGEDVVLPWLRLRRRTHLVAVVLSHPHPDHAGGLPAVLRGVRVDALWDTAQGRALNYRGVYQQTLDVAARQGVVVHDPSAVCGARSFHGAWLEVLAPCPRADPETPANDASFVIRLRWGRASVLLPGDLEMHGEKALLPVLGPVTVLKVGHHGSRTSSTAPFLDALRPRVALVSCGHPSPFGHPHDEVLDRFAARGITLRRTDLEGAVSATLFADGAVR